MAGAGLLLFFWPRLVFLSCIRSSTYLTRWDLLRVYTTVSTQPPCLGLVLLLSPLFSCCY